MCGYRYIHNYNWVAKHRKILSMHENKPFCRADVTLGNLFLLVPSILWVTPCKLNIHKQPILFHELGCDCNGSNTKAQRVSHDGNPAHKIFWLKTPVELAVQVLEVLGQVLCQMVFENYLPALTFLIVFCQPLIMRQELLHVMLSLCCFISWWDKLCCVNQLLKMSQVFKHTLYVLSLQTSIMQFCC